jgi:hypothetical protein
MNYWIVRFVYISLFVVGMIGWTSWLWSSESEQENGRNRVVNNKNNDHGGGDDDDDADDVTVWIEVLLDSDNTSQGVHTKNLIDNKLVRDTATVAMVTTTTTTTTTRLHDCDNRLLTTFNSLDDVADDIPTLSQWSFVELNVEGCPHCGQIDDDDNYQGSKSQQPEPQKVWAIIRLSNVPDDEADRTSQRGLLRRRIGRCSDDNDYVEKTSEDYNTNNHTNRNSKFGLRPCNHHRRWNFNRKHHRDTFADYFCDKLTKLLVETTAATDGDGRYNHQQQNEVGAVMFNQLQMEHAIYGTQVADTTLIDPTLLIASDEQPSIGVGNRRQQRPLRQCRLVNWTTPHPQHQQQQPMSDRSKPRRWEQDK